jgi:anaerobic selenocysteine-containing dehydrogenase
LNGKSLPTILNGDLPGFGQEKILFTLQGSSMKRVLPSVCALDCPDACALSITVDDGRVVKLEGSRDHPITRGFACVKMYRYPERQEHEDRLTTPLKRVGAKGEGRFEPVSWNEALDAIAQKIAAIIDQHGPQSILPYCYAGTMGLVEGKHPLTFFRALGALELDQTICATTGGAAWEMNYGHAKVSPDPEDLVHARCIILWGINAARSNSHIIPILKEARIRGARILHIDPYRNETSRFADENWQIRVGTDAALALAIGNELIRNDWLDKDYLDQFASGLEEYRQACEAWPIERAAEYCGLDLERIRALVQAYATSPSSFIKVGYGMTRNEGGGNAIRAITLLPALTGAWKQLGGGAAISTSGAFHFNTKHSGGHHLIKPGVRHVNMNLLANELARTDNPIQAMFVFNSNPAAVAPDSVGVRAGLRREDLFTVVLEHFQTDTADFADYVLPATTFLEHTDMYTAYGHYHLQWSEPVVKPRGEAKPNTWIFAELAKRLKLTDPTIFWTAEQIARDLLESSHPFMQGITFERLRKERSIKLALPQPFRPYAEGSHFPDRKIRFSPAPRQLDFEVQPTKEYPFRLISPPGPYILNTSMGNLESIRKMAGGEPTMLIHPTDATKIPISHGDQAKITSSTGSIVRKMLVTEDTLPGVLIAVGQWWPKFAPDGKSLNDLTDQRLTDLGGGSTFGNGAVAVSVLTPRE